MISPEEIIFIARRKNGEKKDLRERVSVKRERLHISISHEHLRSWKRLQTGGGGHIRMRTIPIAPWASWFHILHHPFWGLPVKYQVFGRQQVILNSWKVQFDNVQSWCKISNKWDLSVLGRWEEGKKVSRNRLHRQKWICRSALGTRWTRFVRSNKHSCNYPLSHFFFFLFLPRNLLLVSAGMRVQISRVI